jgi:hypothetical protein
VARISQWHELEQATMSSKRRAKRLATDQGLRSERVASPSESRLAGRSLSERVQEELVVRRRGHSWAAVRRFESWGAAARALDALPGAARVDAEFTVGGPEVGPSPHGFTPLRTDSAT